MIHDNHPVAVKEEIYDILVFCHAETGHSGRDKTYAAVKGYYSWIAKDVIAGFVSLCPACQARTQKDDQYFDHQGIDGYYPVHDMVRELSIARGHATPASYRHTASYQPVLAIGMIRLLELSTKNEGAARFTDSDDITFETSFAVETPGSNSSAGKPRSFFPNLALIGNEGSIRDFLESQSVIAHPKSSHVSTQFNKLAKASIASRKPKPAGKTTSLKNKVHKKAVVSEIAFNLSPSSSMHFDTLPHRCHPTSTASTSEDDNMTKSDTWSPRQFYPLLPPQFDSSKQIFSGCIDLKDENNSAMLGHHHDMTSNPVMLECDDLKFDRVPTPASYVGTVNSSVQQEIDQSASKTQLGRSFSISAPPLVWSFSAPNPANSSEYSGILQNTCPGISGANADHGTTTSLLNIPGDHYNWQDSNLEVDNNLDQVLQVVQQVKYPPLMLQLPPHDSLLGQGPRSAPLLGGSLNESNQQDSYPLSARFDSCFSGNVYFNQPPNPNFHISGGEFH